jgi:hypothetical protein
MLKAATFLKQALPHDLPLGIPFGGWLAFKITTHILPYPAFSKRQQQVSGDYRISRRFLVPSYGHFPDDLSKLSFNSVE